MRKNSPSAVLSTAPRTHEGAIASRIKPIDQLRRSVLSCLLWEDTFYENGQSVAERIQGLVKECQPEDVAKLAIQARNEFKLRHVPLLLAREMARLPAYRCHVSGVLFNVIQRPDELGEFLNLYFDGGKRNQAIAKCVKSGLARAFTKFSPYQLAKYDRPGPIKLRDVLFLCHAKPKDAQQAEDWKQLIAGTLPTPDTWEVELSTSPDKKASWQRLLRENKLGALALLRNLRNMQSAGVDIHEIRGALAVCNPGRVLPFRFISAARYAPKLEPELEKLMFQCVSEERKIAGKTVLVVDHSGSMASKLSDKSEMTRFDAAAAGSGRL